MEFERRVQIRVTRLVKGKRTKGFGSGYLVAPRLVLTAAHVLDHMDHRDRMDGDDGDESTGGPVTVSLPGTSEREFPAVVRWLRNDDTVDAALIEIADGHGHDWQAPQSLGDLLSRPPQRYGALIGTRAHPVTASGFPRMQKDTTDGRRLDEQFTGSIVPGSGSLAGRYELTSTDPTPRAPDTPRATDTHHATDTPRPPATPVAGSPWSGMSGAAVLTDDGFGGDLLCGVMRRDRQADGGTRLTATPAAALLTDPAFRAVITEHTGWEPVLEPVEPVRLLTSAAVDRTFRSPASLLRADAEAVAFHGRDTELADLRAWCENTPDAFAIHVMTGPGGQGKTRLARRLADTLGWAGWVTGHLRADLTDTPAPAVDGVPPDLTTLNTTLPLLLVVDYAETRPHVVRRLITHLYRSRHRVRLLLIARSDGAWRTAAFQAVSDVRDLLEEAPVTPLAPLFPTDLPTTTSTETSTQNRRTAFTRAVGDFARLLPEVPTLPQHDDWAALAATLRAPADLAHRRYDNILTLQMTALVTLLQHGPRPVDSPPGTPPERTLIKHEEHFWEDSANTSTYRLDLPVPALGAAVAAAALCGAGTQDEARRIVATLPGLPEHQTATATAWLAGLYPSGESGHYWGSLQPDRVAEYHVSRALDEKGIALPALLAAGSHAQQAQAVTVLARAVVAHSNAGRDSDVERTLLALDSALDDVPLAYQAVQTALAALPHPSRVTLDLNLRLSGALVLADRRRAQDDPHAHDPNLARSLSNLGNRLEEAGHWREALAATTDATTIYLRLVGEDPNAHVAHLATSLSNLGLRLSEAGEWDRALTATEEAVRIRRLLAAENPETFNPQLAAALTNLGLRLSEAGKPTEAVKASEEAVAIYHRLAAANPDSAWEPELAAALTNLGGWLGQEETGRLEEALAAAKEAVAIYHRLVVGNPDAYEPHLAATLSNLGLGLAREGKLEEALSATERAAGIYERLATDNPHAHEPRLATALSNLGIWLWETEKREEALAAIERVASIYERLATNNPHVYAPKLATTLTNLGVWLSNTEQREEALAVAERAVESWRRLTADNQVAYGSNLAESLFFLALMLLLADDLPKTLRTAGEAVAYERGHRGAPAVPSLHLKLHTVLTMKAKSLDDLGSRREATEVRRWLAANPLPPGPPHNRP